MGTARNASGASCRTLTVARLGQIDYQRALELQNALAAARLRDDIADFLLLLEHPHVFTMGKAALAEHVLLDEAERVRRKVDVVWSDRGGEATYHGPGQLVGYPVLDLAHFDLSIPEYLSRLERSLIDYLKGLGIDSKPGDPGFTGVWHNGEKLAAIGIKLNRSVVSHGFALNLTTDLEYFEGIVPCGHAEKRPASVSVEPMIGLKPGSTMTSAGLRPTSATSAFSVNRTRSSSRSAPIVR